MPFVQEKAHKCRATAGARQIFKSISITGPAIHCFTSAMMAVLSRAMTPSEASENGMQLQCLLPNPLTTKSQRGGPASVVCPSP